MSGSWFSLCSISSSQFSACIQTRRNTTQLEQRKKNYLLLSFLRCHTRKKKKDTRTTFSWKCSLPDSWFPWPLSVKSGSFTFITTKWTKVQWDTPYALRSKNTTGWETTHLGAARWHLNHLAQVELAASVAGEEMVWPPRLEFCCTATERVRKFLKNRKKI